VADLPPIPGATILTDDDAIVATCPFPTEEVVEEEVVEEGAEEVEPEVIGRRKAEEEESES